METYFYNGVGSEDFFNEDNWETSAGKYVYNPEYIYVKTDNQDRILLAIDKSGEIYYGCGVPKQVVNYIQNKIDELSLNDVNDVINFIGVLLKKHPIFTNKKISIIGDSISTFEGYIPDGYPSWYPCENDRSSDVTSVNDTWWKKLIDSTGSTLEVNASYGGSTATSIVEGFSPRVPLLGSPDVILIALGTNDSGWKVDIGEIDFNAQSYDLTKFAPAYIKGIKDTMETYPDARIICIAFGMGVEYQNAIKNIASHYNLDYFYVGDISIIHPNKEEMQAVFEKIYNENTLAGILNELLSTKVDKENGKILIPSQYIQEINSSEFIDVKTDNDGKILEGTITDGTKVFIGDVKINGKIVSNDIYNLYNDVDNKVDKEDGKGLINIDFASSKSVIEDTEDRLELKTDNDEKVVSYRRKDGVIVENSGVYTEKLILSDKGMTDFQESLNKFGYKPNLPSDYSNKDYIELPEPKNYALLNLIIDSLPMNDNDISNGYAEYYDGLGNYFKKPCSMEVQGQSTRIYARTGGKGNYTIDFPVDIKIGSWVSQDSFHLKGQAKDVTRSILPTAYKFAYEIMKRLNAKPSRVLYENKNITTTNATGDRVVDWPDNGRCLPDGFPVEVYVNGKYWGLYSWQLKKHRKNYSMDKKDYTSFFLDAGTGMTGPNGIWEGVIQWNYIDIKGPKDLICMDGSEYDGDNPKELIDETSPFYKSSNKKHKGSKQTKEIMQSFSPKYLEIKNLILEGTEDSILQAKEKFEEYFDYNACMLVYIFNCLMYNIDSIEKNTLWAVYKNGKIAPMLWDLDYMYGEIWTGHKAEQPSASMWEGSYATNLWPLKLFWELYENKIKETYCILRHECIISMKSWKNIIYEWNQRVGEDAYERDFEKWPETPSYRENYTNTEYWEELGDVIYALHPTEIPLWDPTIEFPAKHKCALRLYPGSGIYLTYRAKVANVGVCPVTKFYKMFPIVGGYYNSPRRMEKWMEYQLILCDLTNSYNTDSIRASFDVYTTTYPDYIIQCENMKIQHTLPEGGSDYIYVEGHIIKHQIIENDIIVGYNYFIYNGDVTDQDMEKIYINAKQAIDDMENVEPDIPSPKIYYLKVHSKNVKYTQINNIN